MQTGVQTGYMGGELGYRVVQTGHMGDSYTSPIFPGCTHQP